MPFLSIPVRYCRNQINCIEYAAVLERMLRKFKELLAFKMIHLPCQLDDKLVRVLDKDALFKFKRAIKKHPQIILTAEVNLVGKDTWI